MRYAMAMFAFVCRLGGRDESGGDVAAPRMKSNKLLQLLGLRRVDLGQGKHHGCDAEASFVCSSRIAGDNVVLRRHGAKLPWYAVRRQGSQSSRAKSAKQGQVAITESGTPQ